MLTPDVELNFCCNVLTTTSWPCCNCVAEVAALQNRAGNGIVVKNSNQIDISLGSRLREKRTAIGWSQEQLADKLEIDPKDIYAYEVGSKRITADRLPRSPPAELKWPRSPRGTPKFQRTHRRGRVPAPG